MRRSYRARRLERIHQTQNPARASERTARIAVSSGLEGPEAAGGLVGDPPPQVLGGEEPVALLLGAGVAGCDTGRREDLPRRGDGLVGDDPRPGHAGDRHGQLAVVAYSRGADVEADRAGRGGGRDQVGPDYHGPAQLDDGDAGQGDGHGGHGAPDEHADGNWTELDIWLYILAENIPIVPLYYAKERETVVRNGSLVVIHDRDELLPGEELKRVKCRMRSLGCVPCTGAIRSEADTLPKIVEEMISFRRSERENRAIDHDEEGSMELKKREGYF